jgi:hypothetical protein
MKFFWVKNEIAVSPVPSGLCVMATAGTIRKLTLRPTYGEGPPVFRKQACAKHIRARFHYDKRPHSSEHR